MRSDPARAVAADRFDAARAVADAVLYEGYVLYPYRASAAKNRIRWQFGVLVPPTVAAADASERSVMRTECVAQPLAAGSGRPGAQIHLRARFLQVQRRSVEAVSGPGPSFTPAGRLEVGGALHLDWDEAVEHSVDLGPWELDASQAVTREEELRAEGGEDSETLFSPDGSVAGRLRRHRVALTGRVRLEAAPLSGPEGPLWQLRVLLENTTECAAAPDLRDEVLRSSLVAAHLVLGLEHARFVSLLDPPPAAARAAAACVNEGCFPVLIGSDDVMLSSPIILYDHPEVAPESPGDFYDSTEIDELLALRVLTLTDEEKAEARGTDARAAAVVERCGALPPEMWDRLHGALRSLRSLELPGDGARPGPGGGGEEGPPCWEPGLEGDVDPASASVVVNGVELSRGSQVRLRPSRRADAHDLFLSGLLATVAGVFTDFEGRHHVAVTVDDDPATEELAWQGRYLYFDPTELEPAQQGEVAT